MRRDSQSAKKRVRKNLPLPALDGGRPELALSEAEGMGVIEA